jgi:DNA-binding transcriptional regulator GbsR (MarR family)
MAILVRRRDWDKVCRHIEVQNSETGELRDLYKQMRDDLCDFMEKEKEKHSTIEKALLELSTNIKWLDRLIWAIMGLTVLSLLADIISRLWN